MPDRRFGWPCGGPILTWVLARIRLLSRPNITRNASILSRVPWQIASGNTINNKVIFMLKFWRYFFTWWLQVGVFVILHTCIYMTVTGAPKFESAPPTFLATEFSLRGTVCFTTLILYDSRNGHVMVYQNLLVVIEQSGTSFYRRWLLKIYLELKSFESKLVIVM